MGIEYIFAITSDSDVSPATPNNDWLYETPGTGWEDAAPGITTSNKALWSAQRNVTGSEAEAGAGAVAGVAGTWSTPVVVGRFADDGIQGADSTVEGPAGPAGATWLTGAGDPAGGTGDVGDFYLNSTSDGWFEKTGNTPAWESRGDFTGATGETGADGSTGFVYVPKITDQDDIGTSEVAITDMTGLDYPLTPDGSRRFLIYVDIIIKAGFTTCTNTMRLRSGSGGTVADTEFFQDQRTFDGGCLSGYVFHTPSTNDVLTVTMHIENNTGGTGDIWTDGSHPSGVGVTGGDPFNRCYVRIEYYDG
jgi:hypothetical protein